MELLPLLHPRSVLIELIPFLHIFPKLVVADLKGCFLSFLHWEQSVFAGTDLMCRMLTLQVFVPSSPVPIDQTLSPPLSGFLPLASKLYRPHLSLLQGDTSSHYLIHTMVLMVLMT